MNRLHPFGALRASTALMLCCGMLLLGAAAGYSLGGTERVQIQQPPAEPPALSGQPPMEEAQSGQEDAAQVAQMGQAEVSPSAKVLWRCRMACGHTVELVDAQPIVGKTKADVEAAYGAEALESFSPEAVTLALDMPLFCPRHYVLKLENEALTVRKTDDRLVEQVLLTLNVALPADAAAECAGGLAFDSLEDINVYLEGVEG